MPTYKLTSQFVEIIHDYLVVELWPSDEPVLSGERRDRGLIDSAVNRPFQTAYQQQIHPTLVDKGVALFHSLIANHPFANGNKRTAVMAVHVFFCSNEHCMFLSQMETIELARKMARYKEQGKSQEKALNEAKIPIAEATVTFQEMRKIAEASNDKNLRKTLLQAEELKLMVRAGSKGVTWVTAEE